MKLLLTCFFLLLSPPLFADEVEPPLPKELAEALQKSEEREPSRFTGEFSKMLFYLGLLIGLLIIVLWAVKKLQSQQGLKLNQNSLIRILESRPLSHRSMLYLVDIEENTYLVAESHTGVTLLGKIDEKKP